MHSQIFQHAVIFCVDSYVYRRRYDAAVFPGGHFRQVLTVQCHFSLCGRQYSQRNRGKYCHLEHEMNGASCQWRRNEWVVSQTAGGQTYVLREVLTLYSTVVTMCTNGFNIHKFYVLPTQCIYVFCVD